MERKSAPRAPTGLGGLDEILGGGLPRGGIYLIKGEPGTGKSTLGLQFLIDGARAGEPAVYITLSESESGLRASARSHGWSLDGIVIHELGSIGSDVVGQEQYTLFHPTEVELAELTRKIIATTSGLHAPRVVLDSLSELRLLTHDALRYRRQLLALARVFGAQQATVLFLDEGGPEGLADVQIESLAHGVLRLEQSFPEIGDVRRRLRVMKVRGTPFRGGYHDATIETGGMVIHPRLRIADHHADFVRETVSTGVPDLDALLGGGLDRGSTTLLMGPTGSGKSVLVTRIAVAAAARGEHVAMFVFDEVLDTMLARSDGLAMGLREHVESGRIALRAIDPGELAPWQFARAVLHTAERDGARLIVIDSINSYLNAMPDERSLDLALHELFGCLSQLGVVTVTTLVRHGLLGDRAASTVDISYLSDMVVLLSLFEADGALHRAISVVKRRRGAHGNAIHQLHIGPGGFSLGSPLRSYRGVLTGIPEYLGKAVPRRESDGPEGG